MGGLGCDNMTAVLVCLMQNESNEEFSARCARLAAAPVLDNVQNGVGDDADEIIDNIVENATLVTGAPAAVTVHESGDEQFLTPQPSPNDYDAKQTFNDQIAEAEAADEDEVQPPTHFSVETDSS
uniref:Kinesin motor domain-containing protein n=1 Tax=Steinernema glaseri TaxID=37863 RepID=A0A1I7Z598_9BILA